MLCYFTSKLDNKAFSLSIQEQLKWLGANQHALKHVALINETCSFWYNLKGNYFKIIEASQLEIGEITA